MTEQNHPCYRCNGDGWVIIDIIEIGETLRTYENRKCDICNGSGIWPWTVTDVSSAARKP